MSLVYFFQATSGIDPQGVSLSCRLTRYRGLAKNTAQLKMLFTLANLWKARHHLAATAG